MKQYIDFVKNELGQYFNAVVDEIGFLNEVEGKEILVVRQLQGTIFQNSRLQPIQFEIHTDDVLEKLNILNDFVIKNNTGVLTVGLDYIKQNYNTPFVGQTFNPSGIVVATTLYLSGTLVISENINDIEELWIDGELIPFDSIQEDYVASEDNIKDYDSDFVNSTIRSAINKIIVTNLSFNNGLSQKIRNIKQGGNIDEIFKVEVKYLGSDIKYKYNMKLGSHSVIASSTNVPMTTISLTE